MIRGCRGACGPWLPRRLLERERARYGEQEDDPDERNQAAQREREHGAERGALVAARLVLADSAHGGDERSGSDDDPERRHEEPQDREMQAERTPGAEARLGALQGALGAQPIEAGRAQDLAVAFDEAERAHEGATPLAGSDRGVAGVARALRLSAAQRGRRRLAQRGRIEERGGEAERAVAAVHGAVLEDAARQRRPAARATRTRVASVRAGHYRFQFTTSVLPNRSCSVRRFSEKIISESMNPRMYVMLMSCREMARDQAWLPRRSLPSALTTLVPAAFLPSVCPPEASISAS